METSDTPPQRYEDTEYPIRDVNGKVSAIHVRRGFLDEKSAPHIDPTTGKQSKTYYWRGLEGRSSAEMPLFRSEILRVLDQGQPVFVAEGTAATDALIAKGFNAVGTVTGAASLPNEDVLRTLQNFQVYLWPDNDEPGHKHMQRIAERLNQIGIQSRLIDWKEAPPKGDAADLIAQSNGTARELIDHLVNTSTPPIVPSPNPSEPVAVSGAALLGIYAQEARKVDNAQKMGVPRWIDTGFDALNNIIGGGLHSGVIVLHAEPGLGKSSFVLQLAINSKVPSLLISTEMSIQEMTRRAVAQISGRPRRSLLSGSYELGDEMEFATKTLGSVPTLHIVEAITTPAPSSWIEKEMGKLKANSADGRAMLIIDSWHSWVAGLISDDPNANEHQALNMGYNVARKLSVKYDIPVVMVAERNKQSMSKTGMDTTGNAIAGTRKATYGPDLVMGMDFVNKTEEYVPGQPRAVNLLINKSRNGPAGVTIPFLFEGSTMRFSEV